MCDDAFDSEYASVWQERYVRARKEHTCRACGSVITKGERYLYHFNVTDREPSYERACEPCAKLRADFGVEHTLLPPFDLYEQLTDCVREGGESWKPALAELESRLALSWDRKHPGESERNPWRTDDEEAES